MKKTLTVLLVLAVAMCGLFATPTVTGTGSTLKLTTEKAAAYECGFSSAQITDYTTEAVAFTNNKTTYSATKYIYYRTNAKTVFTVSLKSTAFVNDTSTLDTPFGYKVTVGSASQVTVASDDTAKEIFAGTLDNNTTTTANFACQAIVVNSIDDAKAANDTYTATLTLTVSAT